MDPLDLTVAPPRIPRAELGGIVFLPRTIDKARAHLPGGKPGVYVLQGLTTRMLVDHFGIPIETFVDAVQRAESDDDVLAFVQANASAEQVAAWSAFVTARAPGGGDRETALKQYPWLPERPDLTLVLDVLAEDDRRDFAR